MVKERVHSKIYYNFIDKEQRNTIFSSADCGSSTITRLVNNASLCCAIIYDTQSQDYSGVQPKLAFTLGFSQHLRHHRTRTTSLRWIEDDSSSHNVIGKMNRLASPWRDIHMLVNT